MDKNQKLVLFILFITAYFLSSCKKDVKIINFNHFDKKADTVKIDFSLNNIDLIALIEKQSTISLCENKYRLGKIELKDSLYIFPIIIDKNCNDSPLIHNIIDIIVNQDDQILIESELVKETNNLKNELLRHSKERLSAKNHRGLFYNFYWDVKLDEESNKKNFIEVLNGIDLVLDYKSNQIFGKALKQLDLDELKELDSNFYAKLLIADYSPIINAQPPEIENDSIVRF